VKIRLFLSSVLLLITTIIAVGQEDCELTLAQATEEFQAGHFSNIPSILSTCIDKFSTEQQQRANLLLTQTYLLLDDPIGARNSYLAVLRANPEFIADPAIHSVDVVYLSKKFTAAPIFSWFAKVGTNVSPVRVIHDIDAYGEPSVEEDYTLKAGYQIYGGGDLLLRQPISLRAELGYAFYSYEHNASNYFQMDTKRFRENMGWLSAPLSLMYSKDIGKYRPYGYAGYAFSYLMRDRVLIEAVRIAADEDGGKEDKKSPNLNFIEKRNRFNSAIIFGGGVKAKFGLRYLFVDVRYSIGLKNVVNQDNLYANNSESFTSEEYLSSSEPTTAYGHVDDFFRIDNVALSFGFIQPLYKPREVKRARGKISFRSKSGKR
jgi:hypothetical protein